MLSLTPLSLSYTTPLPRVQTTITSRLERSSNLLTALSASAFAAIKYILNTASGMDL